MLVAHEVCREGYPAEVTEPVRHTETIRVEYLGIPLRADDRKLSSGAVSEAAGAVLAADLVFYRAVPSEHQRYISVDYRSERELRLHRGYLRKRCPDRYHTVCEPDIPQIFRTERVIYIQGEEAVEREFELFSESYAVRSPAAKPVNSESFDTFKLCTELFLIGNKPRRERYELFCRYLSGQFFVYKSNRNSDRF